MPGRALGAAGGFLPPFRLALFLLLAHLFQHCFAFFVSITLAAGGNDAAGIGFLLRFWLRSRLCFGQRSPLHFGNRLFNFGAGGTLCGHRARLFQHFFGDMRDDQRFGMFFPLAAVIPFW